MKIVTYNVNGLRSRISQYGSLLKLLNSLDADIICIQETKISKQELTADLIMAEGYETFFSCTRASGKGRGYSGVATFCRVNSAFSSIEVALPVAVEEGFTGLLENSRGVSTEKDRMPAKVEGLEGLSKEDLLKVDSEGRCIITDHGHFVLFNIYGPRAECDDTERLQFKLTFYKILQKRWESLLNQGKRVFIVGDFNIAPAAIDSCAAGPDFGKNQFRRWLRSILAESGGSFFDVFRAKHPERAEAYTCWAQNNGAEEFNYGTRIDHILIAGSCLHQNHDTQSHNFVNCHVKECDILLQFKRWKPENTHRWKGGRSVKLEGSDHAPVYISLREIPSVPQHNTPSLSARYVPEVYGFQQTIVSMLVKRQEATQVKTHGVSHLDYDENITIGSCSESVKRSFQDCSRSGLPSDETFLSPNLESKGFNQRIDELSNNFGNEAAQNTPVTSRSKHTKPRTSQCTATKKKAKQSNSSQLSLRSFFQKKPNLSVDPDISSTDISLGQVDILKEKSESHLTKETDYPNETPIDGYESNSCKKFDFNISPSDQDQGDVNACDSSEKEKNNHALLEWQRIQQLMQNSIPLCKGHGEPCVARVVKKAGPNFRRRFYTCARAERYVIDTIRYRRNQEIAFACVDPA
ncbi:hypothetical protein HHK36_008673 [Tetracentron sinense]|uniref:DNA-(apurinic or apyrimidinic site) endonuclease 2 n=1 Tax=Tetracentron sinense TaxID=13715 RepID=A0A834ZJF5_TETSI|nr:hypothetical protein HHK36_008673 [Tetracentron sinense]